MNNIERFLGKYLLWENKPAQVKGVSTDDMLLIEFLEPSKCPNCGQDLGANQFWMIPTSPLFKENAKPIESI